MAESDINFYKRIPAFDEFQEILKSENFVEAPEDWSVVLTDIKGSTKAIEDGRYRDVNMLGASGITSVINATKGIDIPYVFGGDGATLLVPSSILPQVEEALRSTQRMSLAQFNLELRAGAVPILVLRDMKASVLVGKYQLSEGNCLAQFRGGGLAKAEELLKKGDPSAKVFSPLAEELAPNLEGLSCRWEPMINRRGTMFTFLVTSRQPDATPIYAEVLQQIGDILDHDFRTLSPVSLPQMRRKFSPLKAYHELKLKSGTKRPPIKDFLYLCGIYLLQYFIFRFDMNFGTFKVKKYKKEMVHNSDFKKFDDMLRMVIDCEPAQADQIELALRRLEDEKKIWFGTHRSREAVMTCLVFSATDNNHLHFIDGSHGGYAMAAKQMKSRKSANNP